MNLTGAFLVTKHALGHMLEASGGGGVILNIASNAAVQGFQAGLAYTVSKAGLVALTKNTAGAYADRGVTCAALLLGAMPDTNIAEGLRSGQPCDLEMFQAIGRARPEFVPARSSIPLASVASYCLFLSRDDIAPSANGSCIPFNRYWPCA